MGAIRTVYNHALGVIRIPVLLAVSALRWLDRVGNEVLP